MATVTIEATAHQADVCAVNIGPKQRRMREIFGSVTLALSVGLTVALSAWDVSWPWRLATFLPFYVGVIGLLQARKKT